MNLYFAASPAKIHVRVLSESNAKNLLFSFAFIKNPKRLVALFGDYKPRRIILDSGAFSVWSNGGTIDIEEYARFCVEFRDLLDKSIELNIVNLDVLPGEWGHVPSKEDIEKSAEQGWKNMLFLESKGLKVIHIFHQHEDFSVLDKLKAHSDYIGISPANDVSQKEKHNWMRQCYKYLWDDITKKGLKTHGFAVTAHDPIFDYPFYSVDSSSWVMPARFGRIPICTDRFEIKSISYKDKAQVEQYWDYLKDIGIDKIANTENWHDRVKLGIRAFQKLEEIATYLWLSRGVSWAEPTVSVDNSVVGSESITYNKRKEVS